MLPWAFLLLQVQVASRSSSVSSSSSDEECHTVNCSVSVVAVLVMRRKVRSAKLVIDEDESTTDSQFAFSRGLKSNSSVLQEHFNNNFGKVRI